MISKEEKIKALKEKRRMYKYRIVMTEKMHIHYCKDDAELIAEKIIIDLIDKEIERLTDDR